MSPFYKAIEKQIKSFSENIRKQQENQKKKEK